MDDPRRVSATGSAVPFGALPATPGDHSVAAPASLDVRDPSGPFRVEVALGEWLVKVANGSPARLAVSIAHGTLHDDDKGGIDLAGVEIGLGTSDAEPGEVLNPGPLTELQQAGIVDAVVGHLQTLGLHCVPATLTTAVAGPEGRVLGVLATWPDRHLAWAAFAASGADWDAARGHGWPLAPATPLTSALLVTLPDGATHRFEPDTIRVEGAVCALGRLYHSHVS